MSCNCNCAGYHEMNMDWLINEIKTALDEWQNVKGTIKEEIYKILDIEALPSLISEYIQSGYVNVKQPPDNIKPAKGDGVSDDTDQLTEIFKYAISNKLNVFFPQGTYIISNQLPVKSGMRVYGTGSVSEIKNVSNLPVFYNYENADFIKIDNLKIVAPLGGDFKDTRMVLFENVVFFDCMNCLRFGDNSLGICIDKCKFYNTKENSISWGYNATVNESNNGLFITNCISDSITGTQSKSFIRWYNGNGIYMVNNEIIRSGIAIHAEPIVQCFYLFGSNNIFDLCENNGVLLTTDSATSIRYVELSNCWFGTCGIGFEIHTKGSVSNIKVSDSVILNCEKGGILCNSESELLGCIFNSNIVAYNSKLQDNTYYGTTLSGTMNSIIISNTTTIDSYEYSGKEKACIKLENGINDVIIEGNILTGQYSAIENNTTEGYILIKNNIGIFDTVYELVGANSVFPINGAVKSTENINSILSIKVENNQGFSIFGKVPKDIAPGTQISVILIYSTANTNNIKMRAFYNDTLNKPLTGAEISINDFSGSQLVTEKQIFTVPYEIVGDMPFWLNIENIGTESINVHGIRFAYITRN